MRGELSLSGLQLQEAGAVAQIVPALHDQIKDAAREAGLA